MALKKEVKRLYWNLPTYDEIKEAVIAYLFGLQFYILLRHHDRQRSIHEKDRNYAQRGRKAYRDKGGERRKERGEEREKINLQEEEKIVFNY